MELVPASESGVTFINNVKETSLRSISTYDYMYNGGGVAMADFNNDGLTDLFFTGNDVPNRIYLNEGNLVFRDVTEKAGVNGGKWYTGVTVVDINDDGWNDLYLSCSGPDFRTRSTANELYVNNQDGTFSERSHEFGIADNGLSTQSVFFDMDGDGDQDLFVLNHGWRNLANQESEWLERYRTLPAGEQKRYCNSLYRNDNGAYIQVTNSQVTADPGFGLGVAIADFNDDGRPDIYVCNDFFIPDRLFINYGQARFEEGLADFTGHCSFYSMGCDAADINNDGLTDLCVLDMTPADHVRNKVMMASMNVPLFEYMTETLNYLPQYMFNTLLLNRGYGLMSDIGQLAGVHQTDWSWAPLLSDFDNDGWKDLYVTNGFYRDVKNNDWRMKLNTMMLEENAGPEVIFEHLMSADQTPVPNVMYHNTNGLQFENVSVQWNMARPSFSNGAAYGDLDNDGDLDLAVNNLDEEAFIYRNLASDSGDRHYIQVSLKSTDPKYDPHDAVVNVYTGGQMQSAAFRFNRGYQSHMQERIHVGLGSQTEIDSVVVVWKRGISSVWHHPEPDKLHEYDYANAVIRQFLPEMKRPPAVFSMDRDRIKPAFDHRENDFNDFEKEILLPHRMSQQGPAIAVADVDGDGDEDFFAGGGADEPNAFYLQTTEGRFMRAATPGYSGNSKSEVLGAVFFDADNDGDPDLYIATGGGGEFTAGDSLLKDELLINDGKGSFTSGNDRIPILYRCSKVVKPCDFDLDGDIDLFVGGRNIPGAYPMAEPSVLLENRKGVFSVSEKFKLASDEMWSDALWTDTNGDSLPDLVLAGEWTAVCVYVNEGSQFRYCGECTDENRTGWWSSLVSADFDHDGDMDLIAGNLGLNNKFKPSPEKPLELWLNDFDGNGTRDIVLSKHYRNKVVPVRGRECSSAQMPGLVKKVPSYLEFASASLEELYSPELLKSAYYRKATGFSSVYLENRNGHFVAEELDIRIQMAPVNAMVIGDYNGDGHDDVVGVGNNFTTEVETIPYDAGLGWVMYGRGDGSFDVKTQLNESGIFAPGDVKTMVPVKAGNDVGYLVGRNDERLLLLIIK